MKNTLLIVGLFAFVVLVCGFFALNAYIYHQKQGDPADIHAYRGTLTGEMECLPHVGDGPHTMECAIGMRTDSGEHYALDFSAMSQLAPSIDTGERFTANGMITPIELLSTDHWKKYRVQGIFSVTDSVKKL